MYAALIVMSLLCSGAITLLFRTATGAGLAERRRQMVALAIAEPHLPATFGASLDVDGVSHAFDIVGHSSADPVRWSEAFPLM